MSEFPSGDQDYDSMIGWEPDSVRERKERAKKRAEQESPAMLYCRGMNAWLQTTMPVSAANELFGQFWLPGELAVLFSSAGVGKSILATQIAESLARGIPLAPFDTGAALPPRRVLYLDFELTREQLLMRYSAVGEDGVTMSTPYSFSPDIIRSEMYWNGRVAYGYESFSDMLFAELEAIIYDERIDTLIVDNITFLDRTSTSNINTSLGIMRRLNELKREQFVSILVLAHTPKRHGPSAELTESDLQGSVNLTNFADSVFAIGRSAVSSDLRYLKQIKVRSGRTKFDRTRVAVYRIAKFDLAKCLGVTKQTDRKPVKNFLGFSFVEFGEEKDHFEESGSAAGSAEKQAQITKARLLARKGKSVRKIAAEIGVSRATAQRYAKQP